MAGVVVGMSGGVDSSVAAQLLKEEGLDVEGVIFKQVNAACYEDDSLCCSASAIEEAKEVCWDLDIPLHIRDLRRRFAADVIGPTNGQFKSGLTPSPCTICNSRVRAPELDETRVLRKLDFFATGHYFQVKDGQVFRGQDKKKDQSYMVCLVPKHFFQRWRTPLGKMTKEGVRKIANDLDLPTAHNPDSQDLCFKHLLPSPRRTVYHEGEEVDVYIGRPTIGQKKGFNGKRVLRVLRDVIHVTTEDVAETSASLHSINILVNDLPRKMDIQIGSHADPIQGTIDNGILKLSRPAVLAPGQVAALYNGQQLLGGAVIGRND